MIRSETYGHDNSRRQACIWFERDRIHGVNYKASFTKRGRVKTVVSERRFRTITEARAAVKEFRQS